MPLPVVLTPRRLPSQLPGSDEVQSVSDVQDSPVTAVAHDLIGQEGKRFLALRCVDHIFTAVRRRREQPKQRRQNR
jgi:hypothetical protein